MVDKSQVKYVMSVVQEILYFDYEVFYLNVQYIPLPPPVPRPRFEHVLKFVMDWMAENASVEATPADDFPFARDMLHVIEWIEFYFELT